jgi:AAA+ superfamily predicted ATPase
MSRVTLPAWAEEMRSIFRAATVGQFVISGAIHDLVEHRVDDVSSYYPLGRYLAEVLFEPFETVIFYDRGKGIRIAKGAERFHKYLEILDKFHSTRFAADSGASEDPSRALELPGLLPRAPEQALELIDRFIGSVASGPRTEGGGVAVILDYASFVVPRAEAVFISGGAAANLIKILGWAEDPAVTASNILTVLLSESLLDLASPIVDNPYSAKLKIPLPDGGDIERYIRALAKGESDFSSLCRVDIPVLAEKLVGLSRIHVRNLVLRALRGREQITEKYVTRLRKETIEKEAADKLEFVESKRTLDDVAGHDEAKAWLREDAKLLKKGARAALPMGYLITGRIGTGKTYLIECFAGECGVPFVALKNFREKWVGATEGNLEKIFSILHALGQVVVFVDEADQFAGKRESGEGDSGLSGRIYGMLAREMADTDNRGRILWIFATSRPDLLEVDLKRQGRLDVHIPLFPPEDEKGKRALFLAMARKLGLDLKEADIPPFSFKGPVSGNELEGMLVRAVRRHELQEDGGRKPFPAILRQTAAEFRPSAHTLQLELMDLLAVRECTDDRFLPTRFRALDRETVERRISELQEG